MIDISIHIELNHKADIDNLIEILKQEGIEKPVSIVDSGDSYHINFDSEYEHSEIEFKMSVLYQDYEFTTDLGKSRKEIKLLINRVQSPFSSDNWGRRFNSGPIETTIYFVKRSKAENNKEPNPEFRVLFGDTEREYIVNIIPGINKTTGEKGFIVVKQLNNENEKPDLLINELFPDKTKAFWRGYHAMTTQIDKDFEEFLQTRIKRRKKN